MTEYANDSWDNIDDGLHKFIEDHKTDLKAMFDEEQTLIAKDEADWDEDEKWVENDLDSFAILDRVSVSLNNFIDNVQHQDYVRRNLEAHSYAVIIVTLLGQFYQVLGREVFKEEATAASSVESTTEA